MTQIPTALIHNSEEYIIADIASEKLCIPYGDSGIGQELIEYGLHEYECFIPYLSILKKNQVVLEVGANLGYYTILTGRSLNNTGAMHCIEPVHESYLALAHTVGINGYTNAFIYNLAIADYSGHIEMDICGGSNLSSPILSIGDSVSDNATARMNEWSVEKRRVRCKTLDKFVDDNIIQRVDMLRMDIEGFETKAVAGASKVLEKLMPIGSCFFLEYHPIYHKNPEGEFKNMIHYIIDCGFIPYRPIRWWGRLFENTHSLIYSPDELYQEGGFGYVFFIKER